MIKPNDDDVGTTRLRYSLSIRSQQSQRALFLVAINITAILLLLWDSPRRGGLIIWVSSLGITTCYMYVVARWVWKELNSALLPRLLQFQHLMNLGVMANSAVTGAGVWWLHGSSVESMYIVTLYQCCYGMAGFVNASTHLRNFLTGMTINIGSAVTYWAVQGQNGIGITVPLLSLMFLLIMAARFNTKAFTESIQIREENKALLDARARYLAAANHDLRQPLQALSLYLNVIGEQVPNGPAAQTAKKAKETCRTLEDLFDNLLELSRYDTGQVVPHTSVFELSSIIRQLDTEFELRTRAKGLQWSVTCPSNAWVNTDPILISRLLRNLLDNSLRYTHDGQIAIDVTRRDAILEIVVRDTGRGIQSRDQERIFGDFIRVDGDVTSPEQGMGLGLAIVRRINELLGLNLELRSVPNQGTEVTVRLKEVKPEELQTTSAGARDSHASRSLRLVVWVIEDDESIRDALALQLTQWDCEIRFAKSKADIERLYQLTGRWPDAFFLDDTIDGHEMAIELGRWLLDVQNQPIFIMTATARTDRLDILASLNLPILRKPVDEEKLFSTLATIAGVEKQPVNVTEN